jgi:hypothetical protein
VTCLAPPPVPHRPVPLDIVGHCFNCPRTNNMAAACTHPLRYLHCHREGHLAHACKQPRSLDADDPRRRCSALRSWFSPRGWVTSLWRRCWPDTHPSCHAQLKAPKGRVCPRRQTLPRNPRRKDPDHLTPAPICLHRPHHCRLLHCWGPYIEGCALKCKLFHERQQWLLQKKKCAPL